MEQSYVILKDAENISYGEVQLMQQMANFEIKKGEFVSYCWSIWQEKQIILNILEEWILVKERRGYCRCVCWYRVFLRTVIDKRRREDIDSFPVL